MRLEGNGISPFPGLKRQPPGTCNAVEKIPALVATCNVRTRRKRKLRSRLLPHPQIAELARCNRIVNQILYRARDSPPSFRISSLYHINLSLSFNLSRFSILQE